MGADHNSCLYSFSDYLYDFFLNRETGAIHGHNFTCLINIFNIYKMSIMGQEKKTAPMVDSDPKVSLDIIWHVIVLNDPVKLMSYVVTVF